MEMKSLGVMNVLLRKAKYVRTHKWGRNNTIRYLSERGFIEVLYYVI
jgi:hypothetical protein